MTVTTTRVRAAVRRGGPRLVRLATRAGQNLAGAAAAVVLALVLWGRPLAVAAVASPRWSTAAGAAGEVLRRRRVTLGALACLALACLTAGWVIAWLFAAPGLAWGVARIGMAVYPHTTRGRLRGMFGIDGLATYWDHRRSFSAHAVRQIATTVRPTLTAGLPAVDDDAGLGVTAGQRARRLAAIERLPVTQCGTWMGITTVGPALGLQCYAAHRDVVGVIAPAQTAKTATLGHHVADHPGAVLSTSTKTDVYDHTAALRSLVARSGRVEVLNPEGLGGVPSTMRWSPVVGCWRPSVAAERAGSLVGATSAGSAEDGSFWQDLATKVLRCFLLAADLGGLTMREVHSWVTNPAETADRALQILETTHARDVPHGWAGELRQVLHSGARRTSDSVFLTLSQAVAFMADPAVAAACCPAPGEPVFDTAAFLADRGTVYVIASERPHGSLAPLVAAFTTHLFEAAKTIASYQPKGRLDPPLLLALDEAPLVNPVPLPRWVSDSGGRGIQLEWTCQSPSQLADRWGERGAQTIMNGANALLVFGGLRLQADLEMVSTLCGTRLELVPDPDGLGPARARYERVPVVPPARVRMLPVPTQRTNGQPTAAHGLLIYRASPPTVVRVEPVWKRRDVRRAGPPPAVRPIRDVAADRDPATGPIPVVGVAA